MTSITVLVDAQLIQVIDQPRTRLDKMAGGDTPKKEKKEKKDKKRKSEAADVSMSETPVKPEAVAPVEGTASAEAVHMEVDGEKAAKKAKKEKRKSVGGEAAAAEEQDQKVCLCVLWLWPWDTL